MAVFKVSVHTGTEVGTFYNTTNDSYDQVLLMNHLR